MSQVLEIKNLTVHFSTSDGTVQAVNGLSLSMERGCTLGVVGETGAGKTTLAKAVMGLLKAREQCVKGGEIWYNGHDLLATSDAELRQVRGKQISMIFQDPMTSLNPVIPVGKQIAEVIEVHQKVSGEQAMKQAAEMLDLVGIPKNRGGEYPHQFSGGMKQRVVIAIAMACNPDLLLADEPTTALDVTIQAQILDMIRELRDKNGTSVLLITHDLGVVAQNCEYVAIVYAGEVVEFGNVSQIFKETAHPYTMGLLASVPKLTVQADRLQPISGLMPDPTALPKGCYFAPRCQYATQQCREEHPRERETAPGHMTRCFRLDPLGKEGTNHG